MTQRAVVSVVGPARHEGLPTTCFKGGAKSPCERGPIIGGMAAPSTFRESASTGTYHFICVAKTLVHDPDELGSATAPLARFAMATSSTASLSPSHSFALIRFRAPAPARPIRAGARSNSPRAAGRGLCALEATAWMRRMFGERTYGVTGNPPALQVRGACGRGQRRTGLGTHGAAVALDARRLARGRSAISKAARDVIDACRGFVRALGPDRAETLRGSRSEEGAARDRGERGRGKPFPAADVVSPLHVPASARSRRGSTAPTSRARAHTRPSGSSSIPPYDRAREPRFSGSNPHDPRVPFAGMIAYTEPNHLPAWAGSDLYVPQYSSPTPALRAGGRGRLRSTRPRRLINPSSIGSGWIL